ncbi:WGxxGxxG family protein [Mycolicibacterium tusciae]|jgi:LPXTG-motif cell wall-anchored protein|uniref:WGxxGxxG family protein n=1 Tax=Mycolicibacterium tusciae TaxID=75922 RepID=UPI00031FB77E|nr:WGxxGxxG family protein [Mycolicibacterium tusciae]
MEKYAMRKAVAILGMTGALTFGGAGLAHATAYDSPAPATTTTLAQAQAEHEDDGDNTGLWGLAGLLGLLGLLGLKRRNDHVATAAAPGTTGYGNTPRA